jgi:hypothetical protein
MTRLTTNDLPGDALVDMDALAAYLTDNGVPAYVEMTGGGVATIYAGEPSTVTHPDRGQGPDATVTFTVYPVLIGPGTYMHRTYGRSVAYVGDFYLGADSEHPGLPVGVDGESIGFTLDAIVSFEAVLYVARLIADDLTARAAALAL